MRILLSLLVVSLSILLNISMATEIIVTIPPLNLTLNLGVVPNITSFNSSYITYPDMNLISPTTLYPESIFNLQGWVSYSMFLFLVLLTPLSICFLSSCFINLFYFCRCCGFCGGRKTKIFVKNDDIYKGYTQKQNYFLLIPYIAVYGLICIICCFGIIEIVLFYVSLSSFTAASYHGFERFASYPTTGVTTEVIRITNHGIYVVKKGEEAIRNLGDVSTPFTEVFKLINSLQPTFQLLKEKINFTKGNISRIQEIHYSLQNRKELKQFPKINMITSFEDFSIDLSSAEVALKLVNSKTENIKNKVDDSVSFAQRSLDSINSTVSIVENGNKSIVETLKKFDLNTILNEMNITKAVRYQIYNTIHVLEIIWTIVFCVIYATPMFFLFWGLICITIGKFPFQHFMKLIAFFSYSTFWVFFILAAIQLVTSVVVGHGCFRHEKVILSLDDRIYETLGIKMPYPTAGGNVSLSHGILNSLQHCGPDDSILTSSGFNISSIRARDTITGELKSPFDYIDDYKRIFNQTIQGMNVKENVQLAKENTKLFSNSFNLLQFNHSKNLSDYKFQIHSVMNQLKQLSQFGFEQDKLDNEINELNVASTVIHGDYWSEQNITLLEPNDLPYNQSMNYFVEKKQKILILVELKNIAINETIKIQRNLTLIDERITDIFSNIQYAENVKNSFIQYPGILNGNILDVERIVELLTLKAYVIFHNSSILVSDVMNTLDSLTSCAEYSKFYKEQVQGSICGEAIFHTNFISTCGILIALLMCLLYCIQLVATKRIGSFPPKFVKERISKFKDVIIKMDINTPNVSHEYPKTPEIKESFHLEGVEEIDIENEVFSSSNDYTSESIVEKYDSIVLSDEKDLIVL